jgi:hypothetical protein
VEGRGRGWCWGRNASIAAAVLALGPSVAPAGDGGSNVRLVHVVEKATVARALDGAVRKLARPECQALLDEFEDASGRPLRATLEASGRSARDYLGAVFFYDAPPSVCRTGVLAVTRPGSRAILVCGSRFVRQTGTDSRHAEATLIHEVLHSLGLGENPPSPDYITERVRARCGGR